MKPTDINTIEDAERYCEGLLNDFESGISNKAETLSEFGKYTDRIIQLTKEKELNL